MSYKIGDKVRIKSIDWYNENKDKFGLVPSKGCSFVYAMTLYCDSILTITEKTEDCYLVKENAFNWTDEMIEGLVEDETLIERVDEMSLDKAGQITDFEYEGLAYTLPDGYIFKDENGNVINATKIVLEKKKKEYPKSYEECCMILQDACMTHKGGYKGNVIQTLQKLLICRDAYWKIAGEEMGLGKLWEPDWTNEHQIKYTIYTMGNDVIRHVGNYIHAILAFPSEEMRDAFYENFKELIEQCKELL